MRHELVRWLTPVGPRHDFAPPPEHGRFRQPGVATRHDRRAAARATLRVLGILAALLVVPALAVDLVSAGPSHLLVVWLGSLAVTAAAPSLARRLVRSFARRR